ncbi:uncharacterized protein LOC108459252 [Gossypium arboreum]|uniref:uncharacterized protein LOC108459252 n=1 Tax=Gossypium arboreum TaxID=29729 RepID=UPI0022F174CA|nr:uncharacterized protein LOC108459252 [Gossypium arboreum]
MPSNTETNPKEQLHAITVHNDEELVEDEPKLRQDNKVDKGGDTIKLQACDSVRLSSDQDDITSSSHENNMLAQIVVLQIKELDEWRTTVKKKSGIHDKSRQCHDKPKDESNQLKVGDKVLLDQTDPRVATSEPNRATLFRYSTLSHTEYYDKHTSKKTTVSASKKWKGPGATSSSASTEARHPLLRFSSGPQDDLFQLLRVRPLGVGRCIDWTALEQHVMNTHDEADTIIFRLGGLVRHMSVPEFGAALGLYRGSLWLLRLFYIFTDTYTTRLPAKFASPQFETLTLHQAKLSLSSNPRFQFYLNCAVRYLLGERSSSPSEDVSESLKLVKYVSGSYDSAEGFQLLDKEIAMHEISKSSQEVSSRRLFYLALPPSVYPPVYRMIRKYCMNKSDLSGWTRVVVEKPFGKDLDSAELLGSQIGELFDEPQIYHIDHYLGKELVQNLVINISGRFANRFFLPLWNCDNIDNVRIVFREDFGTEGRGGYFDEYGIIRDIIQNHLLQVFCLVAMEKPVSLKPEHIRDEKVKVLQSVLPIKDEEVVLGQYEGYRDDVTVPDHSNTPTFATVILRIHNERWEGSIITSFHYCCLFYVLLH